MGKVIEAILEVLDIAYHPYKQIYGFIPKEIDRKSLKIAIKRLEQKGYIQSEIMEDELCVRLTDFGLSKQKKSQTKKQEKEHFTIKTKQQKWDKFYRIVVFDIPEQNRRIRDTLRLTLRMLEFYPLQKSVWASKKNYTKELRKLIQDLHLSQYVLIFETKQIYPKLRQI